MINFKGFNIVCLDGLGNAPNCYEELINSNMILRNIFFWIPIFFFFFFNTCYFYSAPSGKWRVQIEQQQTKTLLSVTFLPHLKFRAVTSI